MRNPLNKAIRSAQADTVDAGNKPALSVGSLTENAQPILESVRALTEKIDTSAVDKRREYAESLTALEAEKNKISEARYDADSEAEYDAEYAKANTELNRITDKMIFFKRQIYKLDHTARLPEADYLRAVSDIDNMIREAAAFCANEAERLYARLSELKTDYNALLRETDKVLANLDSSANYLQSKYADRITQYTTDEPGVYKEVATPDPSEWLNHVRRYGNGRGRDYLKMTPGASRAWNDAKDYNERSHF